MKISIVFVYYDRIKQFKNTLDVYRHIHPIGSTVETLVVEERKNVQNGLWHYELTDLQSQCGFRLIEADFEDSYNPCREFNLGVEKADGDVVIITSPECMPVGNVLAETEWVMRMHPEQWLVFGCVDGWGAWRQHSTLAPRGWHYCAAGTKETWKKIGGFDERFSQYLSWDDNDFVRTAVQKNVPIVQYDYPFVVHQEHKHTWGLKEEEIQLKIAQAQALYMEKWGDQNLSDLRSKL